MPENNNLENSNQVNTANNNSGINPQNNTNKYINAQQNNNQTDSTKKLVDTAAKGAAEYFAPGVGSKVYDVAKKVPGVGGAIDKTVEGVANTADKVPGVKKITKKLDDSGAVDMASNAISAIGGSKGGQNKFANTSSSSPANPNGLGSRSNNTGFNQAMLNSNVNDISNAESTQSDLPQENSNATPNRSSLTDNILNSGSGSSSSNGSGDIMGNLAKSYFQKHKLMIIASCSGIAFFVLILFVILGGGAEAANESNGYYDAACNFNDTYVTVTNCEEEPEVIASVNIKDYVLGSISAYTKGAVYSKDALKAAMIVIKTNALSYGNYDGASKNITLESCSSHNMYCDINNGCDLDQANESYKEQLEDIYEEISSYLYVSKSYNSAITNLSSVNALDFNKNILDEFESLSTNNDYISILDTYYKDSSNEEIVVSKLNIFIGDSRTNGMANAGVINDSNSAYATSMGYSWFVGNQTASSETNAASGGILTANSKMNASESYNIIIWLGVNDLGNVNSYFNKYKELAAGDWSRHTIYIVSVGPVNDSQSVYAKNETINNFNNTMKTSINSSGLSNLKYIDLNLDISSLNSSDGLHYSKEDYKKIYNKITSSIDGTTTISRELTLYNMNSYCNYYTLTENDAYWWPIGSDEETSSNIYGGEPRITSITSPYGYRSDPQTGKTAFHAGIDIANGSLSDGSIVIATKSGIVSAIGYQEGGAGFYVKIDHGEGIISNYFHLKENSTIVEVGESVQQGQKIALVGSTGKSTAAHLHFQIDINGKSVNPLDYISAENPRPVNNYADVNIKVIGDNGDYTNSSKNKSVVCNSLLASGFSQNATIGILVNMEVESAHKYNPQVVEYGSGYTYETIYSAPASKAAGFGIIQWSFGRRINLINYAKSNNWDAASLIAQLNFLYHEISTINSYDITEKYITGNYNANDITIAFCKNFERPNGSVKDLTIYDDCFKRSENYLNSITNYVNNGCRE